MSRPVKNNEFVPSSVHLFSMGEDPPEEPSTISLMEEDDVSDASLTSNANTKPVRLKPATRASYWMLDHAIVVLLCLAAAGGLMYGIHFIVDNMREDGVTGPSSLSQKQPDESPQHVFTADEVIRHNSVDDCWVIYYNNIYDMTYYANGHPGGANVITIVCGGDGTGQYELFHQESLLLTIGHLSLGSLSANTDHGGTDDDLVVTGVVVATVTISELESHNTTEDCWVAYYDFVYDMTAYASGHPGGLASVTRLAGEDGTKSYALFHDKELLALIDEYKIGKLLVLTTELESVIEEPSSTPTNVVSETPGTDAPITETPATLLPSLIPSDYPSPLCSRSPSVSMVPTMSTTAFTPTTYSCSKKFAACTCDADCCNLDAGCFRTIDSPTGFCLSDMGEGIGAMCTTHADCSYSLSCFNINSKPIGFCAVSATDFVLISSVPPTTASPVTANPVVPTTPPAVWEIIGSLFETKAPVSTASSGELPTRAPLTTQLPEPETKQPTVSTTTSVSVAPATPFPVSSELTDAPLMLISVALTLEPTQLSATSIEPTSAPNEPSPVHLVSSDPSFEPTYVPIALSLAPMQRTPAPVAPSPVPVAPVLKPTIIPTLYPTTFAPIEEPTLIPPSPPTSNPIVLPTNEPSTSGCSVNRISMEEVAHHDLTEDCWMVLHGQVFDFTAYASTHPGGAVIITSNAGTDATSAYELFHSKELVATLADSLLGVLRAGSKDPC